MTLDPKDKVGTIDPRISLGSVLSIVAIAVSMSIAWANLSSSNARVEERLGEIDRQLTREQNDHDELVQLAADVHVLIEDRAVRAKTDGDAPPAPLPPLPPTGKP